jgi:predicted glycosyltransferase
MESKASYALGKVDFTEKLANKLGKLGKIFFLPRYGAGKDKGPLTSKSFIDTADLVGSADLVVGVGGTIGREAALQGIPSIVVSARTRELRGRTYVNEFLSKKGFPLFIRPVTDVLATAKKHIGTKWNVRKEILQLENPALLIERIVQKKEYEQL